MTKKVTTGCLTCILISILILPGCGSNSQTAQEQPSDSGQTRSQQTAPNHASESEKTSEPEKAGDGKDIVCVSYEAYDNAWDDFNKHITGQSGSHEIVSVHQSMAMPLELKNFTYLLPLSFLGQSQTISNEFDAAVELTMLQSAWAKDADLTYDGKEGYLLTGTDSEGSALEIKVRYDDKADSLRLEGYKDGALDFLFEYSKTREGYAAQYYYEAVVDMVKFDAVYGLCTYRLIFAGTNGSCARYDNVSSEPESIYGGIPDTQSFIDGATHWFTITDGKFSGNLGGQEF